jgi:hypothetical protein
MLKPSTLRIMAGVERRVNKLMELTAVECGFEENIRVTLMYQRRFEKWLSQELEKIQSEEGK